MMVTVRNETQVDVRARNAVLDVAYGPARFKKPSERLRRGRLPALSMVATVDRQVIGTVRLWNVALDGYRPALVLGPLAVHPDWRSRGVGAALMERAIRNARLTGHRAPWLDLARNISFVLGALMLIMFALMLALHHRKLRRG